MPTDLRSLIAASERAASAAGERGEKAHLLMDADQNIGNQLSIATPPATVPPRTQPNQNPDRILNLNAASMSGGLITITLGAEALPNPDVTITPSPFITGIVEFGNGSRFVDLEIDIPLGPLQFVGPGNNTPKSPQNGGVLLSVPAGTLRVFARSDATLITPTVFGTLPGDLLPPIQGATTAANVLVTAFAGYYTRATVLAPTKTLWLGQVAAVAGIDFRGATYAIPAFAKTIRFLRDQVVFPLVAIDLLLLDAFSNILDRVVIPAGARSDTYKIPGNATFFGFGTGTTTPMPTGVKLQAVFELQV